MVVIFDGGQETGVEEAIAKREDNAAAFRCSVAFSPGL